MAIFIPDDNRKRTRSKSSRSITQPKEQKHVLVLYSVFEVNRWPALVTQVTGTVSLSVISLVCSIVLQYCMWERVTSRASSMLKGVETSLILHWRDTVAADNFLGQRKPPYLNVKGLRFSFHFFPLGLTPWYLVTHLLPFLLACKGTLHMLL